MPSGAAFRQCALRGGRGIAVLRPGTRARSRPRAPAPVHLAGRLRDAPRAPRRARPPARWHLPRPRGRQRARRPRGGGSSGRRVLRQEHDGHHTTTWILGSPRSPGHGDRDRAVRTPRSRLWGVPDLHRRVPHWSARRPRRPRLDEVPLVLDTGSRSLTGSVSRGAGRQGVRLRHLPGGVPVEPRDREAPRRPSPRGRCALLGLASRLARVRRRGLVAEYDRLYVPRNDPRWLRRNALVAAGNVGSAELAPVVERYLHDDDPMLAETAEWALERIAERTA